MKKFLRGIGAVAALTMATGANAQIPDYGIFGSGLVTTDIEGTSYSIDSILNSGKPVIIDAFADWCGPCWTYHTEGTLDDVYNSIGEGGTNEVFIIAMEADPSVPESNISDAGTGAGDWTIGGTVHYPLADDDNIADYINLSYYPTLVLVCPDRSTTEVGQASQAEWEAAVAACPGVETGIDPAIIGSTTATEISICGDGSPETELIIAIQNNSVDAIDGVYNIQATIGADVIASEDIALDLPAYAYQEINLGMVSVAMGSNDIVVTITTENDDVTNDNTTITVNASTAPDMGIGDIVIKAEFDGYGSEVGYGFAEGLVAESDPFAAYPMFSGDSYPGQIDFKAIGTWADADAGFNETYASLTTGCYHLYMFDNYGDGLTYGGGSLTISSPNSEETVSVPVDYGSGAGFLFEVSTDGTGGFAGIEDAETIEFARVYPNPTSSGTTVQFEVNQASNVKIELVNTLGQVVYTNNMGEVNGQQNVQIDASDLGEGVYLINITVDENVITKRLSVVR